MKNIHLVPAPVHDIAEQLESSNVQENERMALIQRLEAICEFCTKTINRAKKPYITFPSNKVTFGKKKRFS